MPPVVVASIGSRPLLASRVDLDQLPLLCIVYLHQLAVRVLLDDAVVDQVLHLAMQVLCLCHGVVERVDLLLELCNLSQLINEHLLFSCLSSACLFKLFFRTPSLRILLEQVSTDALGDYRTKQT